jgi:serine/threonine protein kinase/tetratricopeptide (TPR) repeat protein
MSLPKDDSGGVTISGQSIGAALPEYIGPYKIIHLLGQGGMGAVYQAEQFEPFHRIVALKVIRLGLDSEEILARFETERQALAVMDHPSIAKALDAGTTDSGMPYFVMELVDGVPLNEYCDTHSLSTRQRLELFIAICQGIQHAHQKGVIHRDLKPSNLLVTVQDGRPVPKIIDFGIAKAIDRKLSEKALTTQLGMMMGTPAYMSPEQAEASGLDIDTRADIYSLGMVLYELMTGVLPFDLRGLQLAFIAQYVLGDKQAPTPSNRVASLADAEVTPVAHQRQTTPTGLRKELKGDLDWIVLKAINKDRARRYETVNGLGLDIQRHLEDKPVVARPPTFTYTATKFVRRHRIGVSAAAMAVAVLMVLVTGIARERNRAEREGAKAEAISTFLQDMLKSADPWGGGARQITVAEALRAGVKRLSEGAIGDPLVAASIKGTIGSVYLGLGRIADADTLLRSALSERIARSGPASDEAAQSYEDLGNLYHSEGKFDSAAAVFERAQAIRRRIHGPGDTLVATNLLNLSDVANSQGDYGRADSLAREALGILRGVYGERHLALAEAMGGIVSAALNGGNLPRADSVGRAAITLLRSLGRDRTPEATPILNDLAISRSYQGDHVEATALMHTVVAMDSANLGPSHPDLASHLENFGMIYDLAGFRDSNVAVLKQVLAMRRAVLADDNPAIGRTLYNIANADYLRGKYANAEPLFEEALVRMRRAYGPEHTDVVWATGALGRNQYRLGRHSDAERNLRWALNVKDPSGKLGPPEVAKIAPTMISLLMDHRRWSEAEPLALRVLAIRDSLADTLALQTVAQLVRLYERWGKPERAAEYQRRLKTADSGSRR